MTSLCNFIRARQGALVAEWAARVRKMRPAHELPSPVLVDHVPQILARIADMLEAQPTAVAPPEGPRKHAIDRLGRGFDLEEVIKEYTLLRQCILAFWESDVAPTIAISVSLALAAGGTAAPTRFSAPQGMPLCAWIDVRISLQCIALIFCSSLMLC